MQKLVGFGEWGLYMSISLLRNARWFLTFMALLGPKKSLAGNVLLYLTHFTFF